MSQKPLSPHPKYTRDDVRNWIRFGIENEYINPYKKDQILRWVSLLFKNGVVILDLNRRR
jgi:hypothetical protein